jgi:heme iron utilization protein
MTTTAPQTHLNLAQTARSLAARASRAVLGSVQNDGFPFSSLVEVAPLPDGNVLIVMSDLAQHAKNIKANDKASLLLADDLHSSMALAHGRATLTGSLVVTDNSAHLEVWQAVHPGSTLGTFHDFRLYHFEVARAHVIAGFGRVGPVALDGYREATPDLLASSVPGIVQHMNADHAQNLLDYAHGLLGLTWATKARMLLIDCFGFDLHVSSEQQSQVVRYAFEQPLVQVSASRKALVDLAQQARSQLGRLEPEHT